MRPPYSLAWLTDLMQQVVDDLAADGFDWALGQVPADGPVFGTPGMARVDLVSADGDIGPQVWLEGEHTLWITWRNSNTEWWGSQKSDLKLADLLFALCTGRYKPQPRGKLVVGGRHGRKNHTFHLG